MKSMSRRALVVSIGASSLAVAGIAYAASITLTSTTLGSGDAAVSQCNSTAHVTYDSTYNATAGHYEVSAVHLTSGAGCNALHYQVTLSGAGNASLAELTGTLSAAGAANPTVTAGVSSEDVTGVHVLITG